MTTSALRSGIVGMRGSLILRTKTMQYKSTLVCPLSFLSAQDREAIARLGVDVGHTWLPSQLTPRSVPTFRSWCGRRQRNNFHRSYFTGMEVSQNPQKFQVLWHRRALPFRPRPTPHPLSPFSDDALPCPPPVHSLISPSLSNYVFNLFQHPLPPPPPMTFSRPFSPFLTTPAYRR